mgnify:CR=1 FL=1
MTTPPKPDHEKRPFRFKLEGPFLRVSTMLLITPISPNFKGLKCSVFGRFRALQSRNIYGGNGIRGFFSDYNCDGQFLTVGRQGALCGNVHKINGKVWATEHAVITTPSSYTILDFLYYLLIGMDLNQYVSSTAAQPGLAVGTLLNLKTCYPCSTLEQTQISNYLNTKCSEIDVMLTKTRSSIEEYKKLKQAVITQAVTKGVRGKREMKDSGVDYIGQIPAKWVLGKLRNVGDTQNGISKSSEFFGKGFPFVSYSDVYKNYSLPFAVSGLVESTPEEQERYSVKEGDIFFTRTSETIEEVGFSCVCEKDIPNATFAGFLIRVRPFSDRLYTPYAKYYFRSTHLRFYLVKEMNLVTRASLGQSLLKSMPVLLPPLEEQKEIANYLDAKCAEIDRLIAKKEQLVKELESYKKGLIYEVVTGKREV